MGRNVYIEMPLIVTGATVNEVEALGRLSQVLDSKDSEAVTRTLGLSHTDLSNIRSMMTKLGEAGVDHGKRVRRVLANLTEDKQQSMFPPMAVTG